jgi:hypothetical protein
MSIEIGLIYKLKDCFALCKVIVILQDGVKIEILSTGKGHDHKIGSRFTTYSSQLLHISALEQLAFANGS